MFPQPARLRRVTPRVKRTPVPLDSRVTTTLRQPVRGDQVGEYDQHIEVAISYTLPEAMSVMTYDVRVRSLASTRYRLVDLDEVELAGDVLCVPGLAVVEQCLERWLSGTGTQLRLPFP